jgi:pyruvate dehydrogenase E2 component (dihydrolipoamide acetyltransferase)
MEDVRSDSGASAPAATPAPAAQSGPIRNAQIPPRTREYAREQGVSDEVLATIAEHADGRLLPQSIDAYLRGKREGSAGAPPERIASPPPPDSGEYSDSELPQRQRTLIFRLQRSAQTVVPATMEVALDWSAIEAARAQLKSRGENDPGKSPTQFLIFAWCVAQAAKDHPTFRSMLASETVLRQYARLQLGIAVSRPGDELLMARVPDADTLSLEEFSAAASDAIERARAGVDQASEVMQLSLTNMASAGVRMGIPVVVAPAVGTLFIGTPYDQAYPIPGGGIGFRRQANMVFTFDHRIANGVGAARFLEDIRLRVEAISISDRF